MRSERPRFVTQVGTLIVIATLNVFAQSTPGRPAGKGEAGIAEEFRRFRVYPHLDRAYRLINSHRLAEAKDELETCLKLDGRDLEIWSAYFDVLLGLEEYEHLVARFEDLGDLRQEARYRKYHMRAQLEQKRLDAYKALASVAIEQRRHGQAQKFLAKAHSLQPRDASVVRSLGDLAVSREDWEECVRWYRQWLDLSSTAPPEDRYRAAMVLGRAYTQLGQLVHASEAFALALRARPNDIDALTAAAYVLKQEGHLAEALSAFRRALRVAPTGDLNAQVGILHAQIGRPKDALPYLERARELGVSQSIAPAFFGQLGYTYAALNQPRAARDAFEKALPHSSNQAAIYGALGYASLALDDFVSAINQFEHSLSIQDDPRIWRDLTLAYARAGKSEAAARAAERLRQLPHGESLLDADVWNQLAENAFRDGRFREAATWFRQAAGRAKEQGWPALTRAAESLERAEAFPEAAGLWEDLAASTRAPRDARANAAERAGYAQLHLAEPDRAVSSFLLAIRLGRDDWHLRLDRAFTLIKLGRWNEALDESLAALQLHSSARGHTVAAMCFKTLNKPGMAVYHFAQSLESDGELESAEQKYALDELTVLYANEANYDEASRAATRSLRISADPEIALRLVRIQRRMGKYQDARITLNAIDRSRLTKQLKLAVLDEQAGVNSDLSDKSSVVNALQEAARLEPSPGRLFHLGTYFRDLGDLDNAAASVRAGLEADPGNLRYRETLGYIYLQAGQLRRAADMLLRVADQEPDNLQVQQDVADVLRRLGDRPGALRQLRRAIDRAAVGIGSIQGNDNRQQAVSRMRSSVAHMTKRYEATTYFGYQALGAPNSVIDRAAAPLLLSQGGIELARYLAGPDQGVALIGRVMTVGQSDLSGPGLGGALSQGAVGIRYKPFATENLNFSGERLFQLGGDWPASWLARVLYAKEVGGDVRPDEQWHPYSLVYGDLAGFLGTYRSLLAYGEARVGASWGLSNSWVVRPHIVAMGRRDFVGAAGDALLVGAGLGITHYFRDDGDVGPAPSLELRLYGSAADARPFAIDLLNGVKGLMVVTTLRF